MSDTTGKTSRLLQENEVLRRRVEVLEAEAKRFTITEEKIQLSEARLIEAQEVAHLGSWDWDTVRDEITCSQEMYRLFEAAPGKLNCLAQFIERVHPDDREHLQQDIASALRLDRPYDTDFRAKLGDGTWRDLNARGRVFSDRDGKAVRMAGTCMDITERKQAEAELRIKDQVFEDSIASQSVADKDGVITHVNEAFLRLWGYATKEEATGKSVGTFFANPANATPVLEALAAHDAWKGEFLARRTDGSTFVSRAYATSLRSSTGEIIGYQSTNLDVTRERENEAALQESELKFREIVQSLDEGYYSCDMQATLLDHNPAFSRIFGLDPGKSLRGSKMPDFWQNLDDRKRYVTELMTTGFVKNLLANVKTPRGDKLVVIVNSHLVKDEAGRPVRLEGTFTDFTERTRAEEALRQSEEKYRGLFDNAEVGMYRSRLDGSSIVDLNQRLADIFGFTKEEMLASPATMCWADPSAREAMVRLVREHGELRDHEHDIVTKGGEVRTVLTSVKLYPGEGYLEGTTIDITERKQAEKQIARLNSELEGKVVERTAELRDQMELVEKIIHASPVGVFACRADGPCVVANPAIARISGATIEKMLQLNYHELGSWKENGLFDKVQTALATGVDQRAEVHLTTTFGRDAWLNYSITTFDRAGTPHFLMMVEDITDRKTKAEEIRLSRQRLDLHVKHTPLAVIEFTRDGHIARWNPAAAEIFGFSEEEAVGQYWTLIVPEEVRGHLDGVWESLISQRGGGRSTNLNRHKSGRTLHCEWFNTPLADADGAAMGVASLVMDVTERKQAQEELARHRDHLQELVHARTAELQVSEARLIEAQRVGRLGDWQWDVASNVITASGEFYRLFDVEPERIARYQQFVERLHPDDRERVKTEVNKALRQQRAYDTDYRVRLRDGRWRDIHARGELFTDADGTAVRLAGTCLDITERKRAEEAVRESESRYRATLYSIGDAVIATDAKSHINRMNPVAERLTGWTEAEAEDRPLDEVFRIVNEETRSVVESPVARVLREGQVVGLANHTVLIAKDGNERPIADSGAPIRNGKGETTGVVLVFRDQTEERAALRVLADREARFRATFEQAAVGIAHVGLDGTWLRVNQRLCDIVGYTSEELLQKTFQDITHPDDLDTDLKYVQQILAGEIQTYAMEKRYIRKDRSQIWINLTVGPVRDDTGATKYFVSVVEDISARLRAQDALLDQYAILSAILQSTDASVFSLDREYRYTTFNAAHAATMKALYGVDIQIGASLADYQSVPGDWQVARQNLDRALRGEAFVKSAFSGDEGRSRRYFEIFHSPIRGGTSEIIGVSVYSRDVTERKQAEDEIRQLNVTLEQRVRDRTAELEESNRELEAFSYSVSHDLRAPLRAIDGFTRLLADEYAAHMDSEGQRLCSVVRENAKSMSQLIDALLAFSRLGRAEMNLSCVDMGAMATAVFHELTTPESRTRVDFQAGHLPPAVADPTLMRQVWMNLLSNAIKFSSKQQRAVIKVSAQQSQGETVYAVQDHGVGFEMQYVDKLFGVFQRLHSPTEFEGTGVGLALVQRVIRRHGGRVWATGEPDKGATFCFALQQMGA